MRNLAILTAVSALALGFATGDAMAHHAKGSHAAGGFRGILEAPMVNDAGAQVVIHSAHGGGFGNIFNSPTSEGKIDTVGNWKVDTGELANNTVYEICIDAVLFNGGALGAPVFLGDGTSDEDTGNLTVHIDNAISGVPVPDGDWQGPRLQVRVDASDDCMGALLQETGLTVG